MPGVLTHTAIREWLVRRMSLADALPPDVVRLVGVHVVDPELESDEAARTSWIDDGPTVCDLLATWRDELDRFDAVAAVHWPSRRPEVVTLIVNP
jgi:hypothetical protein